jgi:hypothetical protein
MDCLENLEIDIVQVTTMFTERDIIRHAGLTSLLAALTARR